MDAALLEQVAHSTVVDEFVQDFYFDPENAEVEYQKDGRLHQYRLKALAELYGKGLGGSSVCPEDERFLPLLYGIEAAILHHYRFNPDLTDARVALTLDRLAFDPACPPGSDALCKDIQAELRLMLSLHDYSKREVVQAARRIERSVEKHTRASGHRGYLEFISWVLSRGSRV